MRQFFFYIRAALLFLLATVSAAMANDVDPKPGDVIGPHNWQKVQGMVGENFLNRIKQGYSFKIKEPKVYQPLKEYVEATEKYSGKVRLGSNGELLNYVAGLPFPNSTLRILRPDKSWPGISIGDG